MILKRRPRRHTIVTHKVQPSPPPAPDKLLTQEDLEILYAYANLYTEITDKFNIPLFAIGGTLLGCVRNGGPIPWDDDIDYAIQEEHETKLSDPLLLRFLNERGYVLYREPHPAYGRVYHIINVGKEYATQDSLFQISKDRHALIMKGKDKEWKAKNDLISDIFVYKNEKNRYQLCHNLKQYIDTDLFALTKYPYGSTEVYSILKTHDYLVGVYGEAYMTPVRRSYTHRG